MSSDTGIALKPCPFCGARHVEVETVVGGTGNRYVRCLACRAGGPNAPTADRAAKAWNRRPA